MVVEVRLLGHRTRETRAEMQQEIKPGRTQRSKDAKYTRGSGGFRGQWLMRLTR